MGTRGAVRVFPLAFARASERANRASSAAILSSSDSAPEVSFSRKSRTSALMEVPRLAARTRALEWISSSIFKVIFFMTVLHSNCAIVNSQGGCSSALLCSSSSCHLRSPESSPGESKSKLPWLKSMMGETLNSRFQTPRKKGWIPWAGCPGDGLGLESPATVDQTPRRGFHGLPRDGAATGKRRAKIAATRCRCPFSWHVRARGCGRAAGGRGVCRFRRRFQCRRWFR